MDRRSLRIRSCQARSSRFREESASPWMLGCRAPGQEAVRRKACRDRRGIPGTRSAPGHRRRPGSRVDDGCRGSSRRHAPALCRALSFGNAKHPSLPMKTLVLPVRGLAPNDRLSVRSRTDAYTIQLKEALDEQVEFIWSPFTILEHRHTELRRRPPPRRGLSFVVGALLRGAGSRAEGGFATCSDSWGRRRLRASPSGCSAADP